MLNIPNDHLTQINVTRVAFMHQINLLLSDLPWQVE